MKVNIEPFYEDGCTRNLKINVTKDDCYSLDHTLALIIVPLLIKYKEINKGIPRIDLNDVPEEYHPNLEKAWHYILDEMIFAFQEVRDELLPSSHFIPTPTKQQKEKDKRIDNGLILFGKYFRSLWF